MPTNKKPVLSILVDGEKRDRFSRLCGRQGRPMAWAINAFIDQCLASNSINGVSLPQTTTNGEGLAELQEMIADLRDNLTRIGLYTPHEAIEKETTMTYEAEVSESGSTTEETLEQKKARAEIRRMRKAASPPRMEAQIAELLASLDMEDD